MRIQIAFALSFVVSCAGSKPTPTPEAPPAAEASMPWADGKPIVFDQLPDELKGRYMKEVVKPAMAALFQKHDAEKFKDFGCKTCHGPSGKDRHFEMPTDELPKLSWADDMAKHKQKTPGMVEFMEQTVKPEMAKLLGEPPYDPATNKGFGCTSCHMSEQ